ncbi:LysM peptidoglycan-binding domain-containing protein [Alicyclobacillus cycloheptanicus]|uniref:LysM repeat protein n=1 Tax=Alicyclobacillus cycloheptanicus TaxID=1457 RepID=A0ABT9XII7_9BACL|nr:LysM peptidoglycan-binding domain-containing protein [Alicyclobacillus cycloheptanicus]MDQ0189935.1 LysM repeat protein [Alicyclobacillus cycloheptanicus]
MRFKNTLLTLSSLGIVSITGMTTAFASTYTVKGNDTFWSISQRTGIPLQTLLKANPKVNPLNLYPGLKIQLPTTQSSTSTSTAESTKSSAAVGQSSTAASTYTIQGDDTFWSISQQKRIPLAALLDANPNVNPLDLYPGLKVAIPKEITCVATAYTASPSENGWGPVDYFGNPLKLGTIAVDPSVIPLKSKLYISGYSFSALPTGGMVGSATDEGSAIKGDRIDIFVPTSEAVADNFGMQTVKVYVLN